jgi:hypothetical protein
MGKMLSGRVASRLAGRAAYPGAEIVALEGGAEHILHRLGLGHGAVGLLPRGSRIGSDVFYLAAKYMLVSKGRRVSAEA